MMSVIVEDKLMDSIHDECYCRRYTWVMTVLVHFVCLCLALPLTITSRPDPSPLLTHIISD